MSKRIIAIDWNSTLQDQIGEICRLGRGLLKPADFDRWDPPLGHKIGMTEANFTQWAWTSPKIQWLARAYPGAAEAVTGLMERYQVVILTATCHPRMVPLWLRREGIPFDAIITTADKGSVPWDILIDDNPATLARLSESDRRVIRWALPWNAHLCHIPALHDWREAERVLTAEAKC